MKNKITVVIVTYRTNEGVLKKCLKSINKNIKILIVENSKKFRNKDWFTKKYKNLKIICTGTNLGYGGGNNFGLKQVKTKYALILNPDAFCAKDFFKILEIQINSVKNFYLIGCIYKNLKKTVPAGFFDHEKHEKFKKDVFSNKIKPITKVDWIRGFSMVINLNKFKKRNIFDENYFLYFEEIDLCKYVQKKDGNIFFLKTLKVNHLGYKSSTSTKSLKTENLRNWHYMWSSFYFYKKNHSFLFALNKMSGKLIRSLIKTLFYQIIFHKLKRDKYLYRFLGILNSILGFPSNYRINKFD